MIRGFLPAAFVTAVVLSDSSSALACNTASCPLVTQSQGSVRDKGSFRLDLSYRFMDERRTVGDGAGDGLASRVDFEQGQIFSGHHQDKGMQHRQLQLEAAYGITRRLTVFGTLPILNDRDHQQYELVVPGEEIPTHTHTAAVPGAVVSSIVGAHGARGFGDVQLGALFAIRARPDTPVVARVAVELPTGDYDRVDDRGTIERPDIQPGSGSTDWILGLQHARPWGGVVFFTAASVTLSGASPLLYRFGDEFDLSAGISRQAGKRVQVSGQLSLRQWGHDEFRGASVPNTGATLVSLVPGVRVSMPRRFAAYAYAKLPLYQSPNGVQLLPRLDVITGIAKGF
jgi:hypothetical protein